MFTKMNSAAMAAALTLVVSTSNASATAVTYADLAAWSLAVPGYTSLAIPDPAGAFGYDLFGAGTASVSYGGVLFSTSAARGDGEFYNVGPTFIGSNGPLPVLSSQAQTIGVANILITLAAPVKAFALNFDTFYGANVSFELSNGDTVTLPSGANAYDLKGFFGVTDDKAFSSILVTSTDTALNLNALKMGAAVPVIPEPATWIMLLLGFAGLGLFGARRSARRGSAC